MGRKKKYIEMFGSFTEAFNFENLSTLPKFWAIKYGDVFFMKHSV